MNDNEQGNEKSGVGIDDAIELAIEVPELADSIADGATSLLEGILGIFSS